MNFLKNLILHLNGDGKISITKVGGTIMTVAGIIVMLPTLGVTLPAAVVTSATIALAVGAKLGLEGLRNAQDK